MINTRNDLGTRGSKNLTGLAIGLTIAVAALVLLARVGHAQGVPDRGPGVVEPFEVVGTVTDDESGTALAGAWVSLSGSEWGSITDDRGRFRIPDITAGPLALSVQQLGYEALTWEGNVSADTGPLDLRVQPESVVLEGLRVVTDRFRSRRNAVATSVRAYDLQDLTTTSQRTALEFVTLRSGAWAVRCAGRRGDTCLYVRGRAVEPVVYIDEAPVMGGLEYLDTFAPHELYMVEVYGGGRHIRAYTPRFMERAAKQRLSPIALFF